MSIYGVTQNDGYFARIYEYLEDGDTVQETLVILDEEGKVISICEGSLMNDDIIKVYRNNTFVLRFDTEGISIFPLSDLCSTGKEKSWFLQGNHR